ncbi:CDP-alcohol phosphatidyltransferase family protein [Halobacteriales archaeon QS_8_69_26]|nr:MAG: CDP-alcohol phosphatidyltransferase family protein [Halobacteriales archaeon QS_8_69_26]
MTLDQYRDLADRMVEPWVRACDRLGLTPDAVSVIAFLLSVLAAACFALAGREPLLYVAGSVAVAGNGWLDLVDGALAREQGVDSKAGDLLDHVLDRYADIAILVGLAAGIDEYALGLAAVTGVLMTSYLGTQTQAVGLDRSYGGLLGRADRLVLVGVLVLVEAALTVSVLGLGVVGWLLVLFAVVGHLTAVQRFWGAWSDLT